MQVVEVVYRVRDSSLQRQIRVPCKYPFALGIKTYISPLWSTYALRPSCDR